MAGHPRLSIDAVNEDMDGGPSPAMTMTPAARPGAATADRRILLPGIRESATVANSAEQQRAQAEATWRCSIGSAGTAPTSPTH
jgi:hypothetical protein